MNQNNKRPKEIKYFEYKLKEAAEEIDSFQMISMIFGVIAFLLKYKFSVWISLVFFMANYNDQKVNVPTGKYMMNFGLLILSFVLIYLIPS